MPKVSKRSPSSGLRLMQVKPTSQAKQSRTRIGIREHIYVEVLSNVLEKFRH